MTLPIHSLHRAVTAHEYAPLLPNGGVKGETLSLPAGTSVVLLHSVFTEETADRVGQRWLVRTLREVEGRYWHAFIGTQERGDWLNRNGEDEATIPDWIAPAPPPQPVQAESHAIPLDTAVPPASLVADENSQTAQSTD